MSAQIFVILSCDSKNCPNKFDGFYPSADDARSHAAEVGGWRYNGIGDVCSRHPTLPCRDDA